MNNPLTIVVAITYFLLSAALFAYGVNFLILTYRVLRHRKTSTIEPEPPTRWPTVTVQLPIYNERYVAERIIAAAGRLDYPRDRLQIQVLDDSTDETADIVLQAIKKVRESGITIERLHRRDRSGYKAGALQAALPDATGEMIAIFDADFVPPADFLYRTIPYLTEPDVAFIQTRWGHLNRSYSLLTIVQSLAIDAHFMVEQFARSTLGYWFNFNGTGGVWRRAAIVDAGGWTADTLTEDLDLSYRAHLRGWRGRYSRDIVVPGELPPNMNGFRRQQHRWARGSLECGRKLLPEIWRADIPREQKVQATLHLLGYGVHPLLVALILIYPLVARFTAQFPNVAMLYGLAIPFSLTSLAPTIFFIVGQRELGRPWGRMLPKIMAVTIVGTGLMLNTVRAAWQIWRRPNGVFERTAKFGLAQPQQDWTEKKYQLPFDGLVLAETGLGVYSVWTAWLALELGSWGVMAYALLFGIGLLVTAGITAWQASIVYQSRRRLERQKALAPAPSTLP